MTSLRDAVKRELIGDTTTIVEFAESSDFCGKPLYPLQRVLLKLIFLEEMEGWEEDALTWMINGGRGNEIQLSPGLRERRDWCRDKGYEHFAEVELVAGRRSSKGYMTGLAGAFKLWKVRQIPDPSAFYNMDIDRPIEFSCIAASFDQAKTRQFTDYYCLDPSTRVLTADLSWQPIGEVSLGDKLLGFDESSPSPKTHRKMRIADVTSCDRIIRPCYRITFSDGREVTASSEHKWLVARGVAGGARGGRTDSYHLKGIYDPDWIETQDLRPGSLIKSLDGVWDCATDNEAGYLAGVFDGEASLQKGAWSIGFAQKPGDVLDRVETLLRKRGIETRTHLNPNGVAVATISGMSDCLRFLGECRPVRLLKNAPEWMEDRAPYVRLEDCAAVVSVEFIGDREVVAIGTSTKTLLAEGLFSHNSSINRCKALQPYIAKRQEEVITVRADTDIALINELRREGANIQKDFAKFRVLPLAANADTLRGSASIFIVFDEMAFMMPGESRSSAQECYVAAEPSLAQFGKHALVFCNSSPYTRIGQFYEQYKLAMQPKEHKDGWYQMRFAMESPSWALYDKWWIDPDRKWSNAIMVSPDWEDQVEPDVSDSLLDDKNLTMREAERLKEKANPDSYKVEYRGQWAEVLDAYLRPEMVDRAFSGLLPSGEVCSRSFGGTYKFTYLAHCDPASTTAGFGFAMGHVEEFPDETGIFPDGVARHVVFDMVKRWNPADFPGGTINYIKVKDELAHLINLYRPAALTFDQYNSRGMIDELREETRKMSIQETRIGEVTATQKVNWNRWEAFKTALYLGLVHVPPDCFEETPNGLFDHAEWAKQELKFLQEVQTGQTRRVDKQELGPVTTKDVADCIAEVVVKFLGSYVDDMMSKQFGVPVTFGSEGGFQIGGRQQGGPMGGIGMPGEGSRIGQRGHQHPGFDTFYGRRSNADHSAARGIRPRKRGSR